MSLANIYPYFRERLDGLGFSEWEDGFGRENIPSSILDKSYHILVESLAGGSINQTHQNVTASLSVQIIYKGYARPVEAIEQALADTELLVKDICKVSNRTRDMLNIVYDGSALEPLSVDNDNVVISRLDFTAFVILGPEEI